MKEFFIKLLATGLAALIVTFAMEGFDIFSSSRQINTLTGTYATMEAVDADIVQRMLTNMDFYPEEIALINPNSQTAPGYREFRSNETYVSYYDVASFRSSVEAFFRDAFYRMYEGRTSLSAVYIVDFSAMTQAIFQTYYATLYSKNTSDELVTFLADDAYNHDELIQETGTFTIADGNIICTPVNPFSTSVMGYDLSGNTLTLRFFDAVEVYSRVS